jgi:hypothetical protein
MISIKECLQIMHAGAVFSLKVVSYDKRRKDRCGRVLEYDEAQLVWGDGGKDRVRAKGEREPTALERSMMAPIVDNSRQPNHAWHYTRNIRLLSQGLHTEAIVKVHPPLIIEFNGQTTTP